MQNYLIINTLVNTPRETFHTFSKLAKNSGCNIVESRLDVFEEQSSIVLFLSGSWNEVAKMEDMLIKLEKTSNITILIKRTKTPFSTGETMPYAIDIVGVDKIGLTQEIIDFMLKNKLIFSHISSNIYTSSQTGAKMFSLHMTISLPLDASIAVVRGDFMELCDNLNLDAIMEPIK